MIGQRSHDRDGYIPIGQPFCRKGNGGLRPANEFNIGIAWSWSAHNPNYGIVGLFSFDGGKI